MKSVHPVPTWIIRGLVILGMALCVPPTLTGLVLLATDVGDGSSGELDGLGIVLGGLLLVGCLIALVVLAVLLLLLFKAPRVGLVIVIVLAALGVLPVFGLFAGDPDINQVAGVVLFGGGGLAVIALAVWALKGGAERAPYAESARVSQEP